MTEEICAVVLLPKYRMSATEQIGYRQPLTYSGFDDSLPCELDWIPFFAPKIDVSIFIYGLRHCNFFLQK